MSHLILLTFDWVPDLPRGYVRDLRIRWALEEAGLPYEIACVPLEIKTSDHFMHQPFGQVPWIKDGDKSIFESGAILIHLGERSAALMPSDPKGRIETLEWVFAALNSVEMAALPWSLFHFAEDTSNSPGRQHLESFLQARLKHMDAVLAERTWLAGDFNIADILMVDVLRLVHRFNGLAEFSNCRSYMERGIARPAFIKAHADQIAHFAAADEWRAAAGH